ncbi:MAG: tripartite tricarboxylate transporter TctB family protein [Rhodospirillales bacterium]|nr:tripartite tricarboxylate transporter TctB family protein [Rhodospirillales bacterium]
MRPRSAQDFCAGLMFIAFAAAGLFFARDLEMGSASFMETGYMPRLVSFVLLAIGIAVAVRALFREGPGLASWAWRPLILLTATILAAGFLLPKAGLVVTAVVVALASNWAAAPLGLPRIAALAALLVVFSVALFHYGLELPIPVWPR